MCLGIPGKVKEIFEIDHIKMGKVDYSGVEVEVCLEATPEVKVNEYVIVHAGFSISRLNETEAKETLDLLKGIERIEQEDHNE
jgi:hydrogenase expression/formation protein HypC